MTKPENLNVFIDNMYTSAFEESKNTDGYELRKLRQESMNQMIESCFTQDEQKFVEEILFDVMADAEDEARIYYEQGIKDGIWLLKCLGVIA